jgi:hypothetical protein
MYVNLYRVWSVQIKSGYLGLSQIRLGQILVSNLNVIHDRECSSSSATIKT